MSNNRHERTHTHLLCQLASPGLGFRPGSIRGRGLLCHMGHLFLHLCKAILPVLHVEAQVADALLGAAQRLARQVGIVLRRHQLRLQTNTPRLKGT